jgi:hypothetical protein
MYLCNAFSGHFLPDRVNCNEMDHRAGRVNCRCDSLRICTDRSSFVLRQCNVSNIHLVALAYCRVRLLRLIGLLTLLCMFIREFRQIVKMKNVSVSHTYAYTINVSQKPFRHFVNLAGRSVSALLTVAMETATASVYFMQYILK